MICGHQREDDCGCVQTPPDPKPTAPPTVAPASDEEISDTKERAKRVTAIGSVRALNLIARIEADRARIEADRARSEADRARIRELEGAASANAHELAVGEALREAVFGRPVSDFMESFEIVRMAQDLHDTISLANSELATAREQIKAKDEEIARLRDALTTLENRLFGLAELTPICQLHRHGLSAMVDFIRAALSKPEPGR